MNADELLDELIDADLDDWGSMCGVATNLLASGCEIEDVADHLVDEFDVTPAQALSLAWLMSDEAT